MLKTTKRISLMLIFFAFTLINIACSPKEMTFHPKGEVNIGGGVTGNVKK